ncbi:hypothetical protein [Amycolatopsis lexingtonensis]|uniref:hypothetical protein n=1 Tax=Amycolatopsis lexingtonensis TaxID=218822 RepID=UPI003F70EF5A
MATTGHRRKTAGWKSSFRLQLYLDEVDNPTATYAALVLRKASSTGQVASFYVTDHEQELWRRLLGTRQNSVSGDGCAVVALAALGATTALAAAWARAKWGA